jgi:hypothetical protein
MSEKGISGDGSLSSHPHPGVRMGVGGEEIGWQSWLNLTSPSPSLRSESERRGKGYNETGEAEWGAGGVE